MHALVIFVLVSKFFATQHQHSPPNSTASWYSAAFVYASFVESRTASQILYQRSVFFSKYGRSNIFDCGQKLSGRHRLALRWLLILSGNVELNPGPEISFESLSFDCLKAVLKIVKEGDQVFRMPDTKANVIVALQQQNQNFVNLALQNVLGISQPAASQAVRDESSASKLAQLPEFSFSDTKKWFELVDQFLAGCRDEQVKKNSVLRVVPLDIQKQSGIDVSAPYEAIKAKLLAHCDLTREQKLRKLLGSQELGDQKPSVALRALQELGQANSDLVRIRFLEMLPPEVRVVLASLTGSSIENLAAAADKMMETIANNPTTVNKVSSDVQARATSPIGLLRSQLDQLTACVASQSKQISELTQAVQAITMGNRLDRSRGRSQSRDTPWQRANSPRQQRSPGPTQQRQQRSSRFDSPANPNNSSSRDWCYYHFNFGSNAQRCVAPCSYNRRTYGGQSRSGNGAAPLDGLRRG
jgi:hypothetical protein